MVPDEAMVTRLTDELHVLLTRGRLVKGVNLLLRRQDDRILVQMMAVSVRTLGLLLASLSDPEELGARDSLTRRITPSEARTTPDDWEYELVATRYPIDDSVVFLARIRLPVRDLTEVVARLRQRL